MVICGLGFAVFGPGVGTVLAAVLPRSAVDCIVYVYLCLMCISFFFFELFLNINR